MLITISLIGGVLCLDRIYLQSLASRPVVTGAIIGLVLQDLRTGVMIGALLELLWIDQSPIGTMVPPNDTISTVSSPLHVFCWTINRCICSKELISFSFLICWPTAILGQQLDIFIIKRNERPSREIRGIPTACGAISGELKRTSGWLS